MNRDASRALALTAGAVIIALTAAAFWLSYAHLAGVAATYGLRRSPARTWAWPATLDLFIVAGELLMLRAALVRRVDPWAIGLTVVGSLGSIALNVAGVGTSAALLDYVVAAVPPTAALLAFGALMRQVHQALTEAGARHQDPTSDLPQIAEPVPVVSVERVSVTPSVHLPEVVVPAAVAKPYKTHPRELVAAAETRPKVVTEVVTVTPADLRRQARKLNRQVVAETRRPVTVERLRSELGLSRRDAADLRREIVNGDHQ